jgi:Zn-dependent peptidase ImmA (M78 family)
VRRGFKSEAERVADRIRSVLGLDASDSLDPEAVAAYLGARVVAADTLVARAKLRQLKAIQDDAFSAVTFKLPDSRVVVVYNPLQKPARRRSDIAHELSHLILKHETRTVEMIAGHSLFTCNPEQEAEADWLAGCLLLPRPLLLAAARSGMSAAEVADANGVTLSMARYRLNASGAMLQARRGRGAQVITLSTPD